MVGSHRNPIIVIHKLTRKAINLHNEITTKYLIALESEFSARISRNAMDLTRN